MALTNSAKPTTSLTNSAQPTRGTTWATALNTWGAETLTWLETAATMNNPSKQSTTLTNQSKQA